MDLALFDFDGTITHQDTFTPFIFYAIVNYSRYIYCLLCNYILKYISC